MGRYMTVVIKDEYKNDEFLTELNHKLTALYGATSAHLFNTWQYIQSEADFMNNTREGRKQIPHFERPITKETLHENFFWYRMGEYTCKISSPVAAEAVNAIAVHKWIRVAGSQYIDRGKSENYSAPVLHQYLDDALAEAGLNVKEVWRIS